MKKADLLGKKFNKWTVIKELGNIGPGKDISWECQCDCGTIRPVKSYYLTHGYSRQCVACANKPKKYEEELSDCIWNKILRNAKKRNIQVNITKEEAYRLFLKQDRKCNLSGVNLKFSETGTEVNQGVGTASLDRIDSKKDYSLDNIQWIHKDINRMKNIFDEEYFFKICRLIAEKNKI